MLLRFGGARKPVLRRKELARGGRETHCLRASTHARRCISMAASDLGPKALNVAALNDLCHLCPPWTQAGCALNAVSREVSKLAADARRRRRRKLLALRNEIRRHTFVTLRNCTQVPSRWFKIHGVREETVAVSAQKSVVPSRIVDARRSFSRASRCVTTRAASVSSCCLSTSGRRSS